MSYIKKNDYIDGVVITPELFLRIIEALDGTRTTDIAIKGNLEILKDKLKINNIAVNASADDLNGLANRTAGITEANKPLIVGATKELDYLRVNSLAVAQLLEDHPAVSNSTGKVYAFEKFC
jgi:hypothetical protein